MHALLSVLLLLPAADAPIEADIIVRGATLIDGSGKKGEVGDIAIKGERIVALGAFKFANKPEVIDGKGLIVAPGFIDLHTHSDDAMVKKETRANLNYLTQGVTTIVTGNCGFGPHDVGDYFKKMDAGGVGSNVLHLVPHNALRKHVMGNVNRAPTADELKKMQAIVEQGMKDGACGFSTGLIYDPGSWAKTDELIALASVAGKYGGIYASHIRNEGVKILEATEEAIKIGREGKLPVHISHMKASGRKAWGMSSDQIALILKARKEGLTVTADQYPYIATSTSLSAIVIPTRFREGTDKEYRARFDDAELAPKIRQSLDELLKERKGGDEIRIARYKPKTAWQGKSLAEIAKEEKKTATDIVMEIERNGGAGIVNFALKEEDVRIIMKQPFVATASDGSARVPDDTIPHPRSYGTFPRKVGLYALADEIVTLEFAVRSCSGLPADILRLKERGYLKVGYFADLVVFDTKTFLDAATFDKPHQYSPGVRHLFVNGKLAIKDGEETKELAGKVIRHQVK